MTNTDLYYLYMFNFNKFFGLTFFQNILINYYYKLLNFIQICTIINLFYMHDVAFVSYGNKKILSNSI